MAFLFIVMKTQKPRASKNVLRDFTHLLLSMARAFASAVKISWRREG